MVAAAGSRAALSLRATAATAAWIVLSLVAVVLVYQRVMLLNRVPLPKPPAALEDRAQEALTSLGFDPAGAVDRASGLGLSLDYARFIDATSTAPDRWNMLHTVRPETFIFWYRTSPQLLIPWGSEHQIGRANPPLTTAGMTLVAVDANGRLSEFHAVPNPSSPDTPAPPADWNKLFVAAGLQYRPVRAGEVPDRAPVLRRRAPGLGRPAARSPGAHDPNRGGRDRRAAGLLRPRRTMERVRPAPSGRLLLSSRGSSEAWPRSSCPG